MTFPWLKNVRLAKVKRRENGRFRSEKQTHEPIIEETSELSRGQIAFFLVAIGLTFFILYFSVSGGYELGASSWWIYVLLAANFLFIAYFAAGLWRRFSYLLRADSKSRVGARLHTFYVRLFVFAAAIPAILIALFSGLTIGRGIQTWLSEQVSGTIDSTQAFGKEIVSQASAAAESDIIAMASDLDAASGQFKSEPSNYQAYFANQASRRGFVAAYLYDGSGKLLMQAVRPQGTPASVAPDNDNFATASAGAIAINIDDNLTVRAFYRLSGYENVFLQVIRLANPEQQKLVKQAYEVVTAYRGLEARLAQIQFIFVLAYLETVLLVGVGAAWLGLTSASRISEPIASLAGAADKVRSGDLNVQITPDTRFEELFALTTTFNRMTSDLMQQQDALKASRQLAEQRTAFIQTVFNGVSAGIVSLNGKGKILTANGAAARILGVSADELNQRGIFAIAPEFRDIAASAKEKQVSQGQLEIIRENEQMVFDVRASYVGKDLVITFDEISAILAAQRQAAWKDVARRIAHEIKNPLTPIHLSAERLARKFSKQITEDKETFVRMTDTIIRQVTDIGRMVDEFSSFARMPSSKLEPGDIAELTKQAVFAQKIASPDIEFEYHSPPEPVDILMDSRLIAQALGNILKNATESITQSIAEGQTKNPKIEVEISIENEKAVIEICDNGMGFPKQGRQKLLEPYVTTRSKGTGLGLAIVSKVLEESNGYLRLEDRIDEIRGARVIIYLPIYKELKGTKKVSKEVNRGS